MTYKWAAGKRVPVSAQIAGEVCEGLEKEGRLNAAELVIVSEPEDAPLHRCFEWNDERAACKWREQQARNIINGLVVVREDAEPVRRFFNLESSENNYISIDLILQSPDKTQELLQQALAELQSFRRKYQNLAELAGVINEINKL